MLKGQRESLKSGCKVPTVSKACAVVCNLGVRGIGLSSASVARELGITPSPVGGTVALAQGSRLREEFMVRRVN